MITSFIGPNGAGKSTLLSIISRLIGMDAGKVLIDGKEISAYKSNDLAKKNQHFKAVQPDQHQADCQGARQLRQVSLFTGKALERGLGICRRSD